MEKENKQLAPKEPAAKSGVDYADLADSCSGSVVSGTECTGLIQTPPENEQESEAYSDLYAIPKPDAEPTQGTREKSEKN